MLFHLLHSQCQWFDTIKKQLNLTQQQAKPSSLPWQQAAPGSSSNNSSLPASYSNGQSKVVAWLQESEEMDKCAEGKCHFPFLSRERIWFHGQIKSHTFNLPGSLKNPERRVHDSNADCVCKCNFQSLHGASPTWRSWASYCRAWRSYRGHSQHLTLQKCRW